MIVSGGWKHQPVCCPRRISFDPIPVGGSHFLIQKISESDHITIATIVRLTLAYILFFNYIHPLFTHISRTGVWITGLTPRKVCFHSVTQISRPEARRHWRAVWPPIWYHQTSWWPSETNWRFRSMGTPPKNCQIPGGEWGFLLLRLLSILQHHNCHNSTAMARHCMTLFKKKYIRYL